jgi:hypothetical protein
MVIVAEPLLPSGLPLAADWAAISNKEQLWLRVEVVLPGAVDTGL